MTDDAIASLVEAYRRHIAWMRSRADSYLNGECRHLEQQGNCLVDKTTEVGEELLRRASKLQAVIASYEERAREEVFQLGWPISKLSLKAANIAGTVHRSTLGPRNELTEQP